VNARTLLPVFLFFAWTGAVCAAPAETARPAGEPSVRVTPAEGSVVKGKVPIRVTVPDPAVVQAVDFTTAYGAQRVKGTGTFEFTWDTTKVGNGQKWVEISVIAKDGGTIAAKTCTWEVRN